MPPPAASATPLGRALTIHAARRDADERSTRQAAVAAAARSVHGPLDGMLHGVADATRAALEADAIVIYTLGADGPSRWRRSVPACPRPATASPRRPSPRRAAWSTPTVASSPRRRASWPAASPCRSPAAASAAPSPGCTAPSGRSPTATRRTSAAFAQIAALAHRPRDAGAGARPPRGAARGLPRDHRGARRHARAGRDLRGRGLGRPPRPAGRRGGRRHRIGRPRPAGHGLRTVVPALSTTRARPARCCSWPPARVASCSAPTLVRPPRLGRRAPPAARRRPELRALHPRRQPAAGLPAVLGVVWPEAHAASDDDLDLARHLGTASAAAIDRAETLASERQARARAQELQRIGGLMASNLDAAAVLREIVSQAALLLNADSCALRLVEGDRLVVRAVQGEAAELLAGEQAPLTGGPTGEVLARRTPVAVADMAADDRFLPDDPLVQARFAAYLGAPILSPDGDLRGVLALYDRRRAGVEARRARGARGVRQLRHRRPPERPALPARRAGEGRSPRPSSPRSPTVSSWSTPTRASRCGTARRPTMTGVPLAGRPAPHPARAAARRAGRPRRRGARSAAGGGRVGGGVEVRLSRGEREIWLRPGLPSCATPSRTGSAPSTRCATSPRTASSTS